MAQVLLRIPDELADRLRDAVPARQRSAYIQKLLEQALPPKDDDWLYRIALEVEADEVLREEMKIWDTAVGDGLDDLP